MFLTGRKKLLIMAMSFLIQVFRLIADFMIFFDVYVFLFLCLLKLICWYLIDTYLLDCLLSLIFLHYEFLLFQNLIAFLF